MSTVQDDLRSYIETTLNDNTYGVNFKVFIYETKQNGTNSQYQSINNSLQLEEKAFIPCMLVDFDGDKVPIEGSQLIEYTIPMVLRVNTDGNLSSLDDIFTNAGFEDFKGAMQEFTTKLTGNVETINGVNYAFNTDILTPISDIDTQQNYNYVNFGITIFANSGDTFFGNQVTYKLGRETAPAITATTVTPYSRNISKGFNAETNQLLETNTAVSVIKDNVWQTTLSFYYTNTEILSEIFKQAQTNTISQNTVYTLETTFPIYYATENDDKTYTDSKRVIIDGIGIFPELGEKIYMTITFREYAL